MCLHIGDTSVFATKRGEKENGPFVVLLAILWGVESLREFVSDVLLLLWWWWLCFNSS